MMMRKTRKKVSSCTTAMSEITSLTTPHYSVLPLREWIVKIPAC